MSSKLNKYVVIADIHIGKKDARRLEKELEEYFFGKLKEMDDEINIVFIAGDMFDRILKLNESAGVLAIEMLGDKWQKFFYWDPFYWAYKGNDITLSQSGTWGEILIYSSLVLLLSGIVYILLAPKIRKGLE